MPHGVNRSAMETLQHVLPERTNVPEYDSRYWKYCCMVYKQRIREFQCGDVPCASSVVGYHPTSDTVWLALQNYAV
jgi:hypothetical protein